MRSLRILGLAGTPILGLLAALETQGAVRWWHVALALLLLGFVPLVIAPGLVDRGMRRVLQR